MRIAVSNLKRFIHRGHKEYLLRPTVERVRSRCECPQDIYYYHDAIAVVVRIQSCPTYSDWVIQYGVLRDLMPRISG